MTVPPSWWLSNRWPARVLAPLGWLYAAVGAARRWYWRRRAPWLDVPVLVVGNLFVGGTGKTPLVLHLVARLRARGRRPGVLLRGYRGRARHWPQHVDAGSDPAIVGDEAVLIAARSGVPVVAGPDRIADARALLEAGCDVLVSDDGLQHYRLRRDAEVAVVDAVRGLGNGRCLPAGPLREPPGRLRHADLVLARDGTWAGAHGTYSLIPEPLRPLGDAETAGPPPGAGTRVHAIAGIGRPEGFFTSLAELGLTVVRHPFPDHHAYTVEDLEFTEPLPVVMTEKDAVKCRDLAPHAWYLPVSVRPDAAADEAIERLLQRLNAAREHRWNHLP